MSSVFKVQKTIREIFLKILDNHSLEQLNKIPEGFKNNVIWNVAHCISSQQVLVYKLSGLPTLVSDEFIDKYKKGTKPEADVSQAELDEIKRLLFATLEQTEKDYAENVFNHYTFYKTSMGFDLENVQDALDFVSYHEGIHTGIIMSLQKFI
ncbi:DinB family protein [Flavobacterium sp. ANB]|uniref:DinB family protein n=1 Tax=unclassified Flavobacterium TaxID=196869 RepID=UPI0012B7A9C4|nr:MULTISPECIES: DinB family protein [unclassified Flavobacterium]MBF4517249.1 DinB family protein [Flavobacterium sp. ANB]MTD70626.1 DinB family protein [Flavobacterium sp. LC2016-13]